MLSTPTLRLYWTDDVIGAELGGALKNVIAIAAGVAIGAALPFVAQSMIADVLPVRARVALYAGPLATAAGFGLLVSLLFALVPLMRARSVSAATLMRGAVVQQGGRLAGVL